MRCGVCKDNDDMAKKKSSISNAELRSFLKKYPDTGVMELLIADLPGVLRGKRIRRHEFEKTLHGTLGPGNASIRHGRPD